MPGGQRALINAVWAQNGTTPIDAVRFVVRNAGFAQSLIGLGLSFAGPDASEFGITKVQWTCLSTRSGQCANASAIGDVDQTTAVALANGALLQ